MASAMLRVDVVGGSELVLGAYSPRSPLVIPVGIQEFCRHVSWNPAKIWQKWCDPQVQWYEAPHGSFIYWNQENRCWWICDSAGRVTYKARDNHGKIESVQSWRSCEGLYSQPPACVQLLQTSDLNHS
ncbi:hypothetical protein AB1Y20_010871 [Prymnesium parvum]|uniref:Uncharacterized protein n=1 Tax=Prymnesium parvum TaxID=97485 RepID=A0AB34IPQ7_PRYPA